MVDIQELALRLDKAMTSATATPQLENPISIDAAYAVQAAAMAMRYARGERRVGIKMGFTSHAKMKQMGIDEMIWGRLTDAMQVSDGDAISYDEYVHPRVEPEIAFRLKSPLSAEPTKEQAMSAIDSVAPALEIIDSRYKNFKFSLTDVIADNSSSSKFVIGSWMSPDLDFSDLEMALKIDGETRQSGKTSAILDHPINSLIAAARLASQAGEPLQPGDIVMAGGATAAEALVPGTTVTLQTQDMGSVGFRVEQ